MLRLGLFPILILLVVLLILVLVWSVLGVLRVYRQSHRLSGPHATVLMVLCALAWLGACFFFSLFASLGHSSHAMRDMLPAYLVSLLVLVVVPAAFLRIVHIRATRQQAAERSQRS